MLELDAVDASYGRVPAIRSVALAVAANEIVTLIGSNGAGKSTTLRTISGLLPIQRGEIRFLGESIGGRRAHEIVRRGIVHVPEGRRIFHEVTAASKEKVLDALGGAASKLRAELGESLATVQKFDVPLAEATTPSLEALRAYSLGEKAASEKGYAAGLPYMQRAIQLDPSFAMGYRAVGELYGGLFELGRASEYFAKAF